MRISDWSSDVCSSDLSWSCPCRSGISLCAISPAPTNLSRSEAMRSTRRCPPYARFPKPRPDARDGKGLRHRRVAQVTFMENAGIERNYEYRQHCASHSTMPRKAVNEDMPPDTTLKA